MVTGETKSFFSFAKSVSQRCILLSTFEGNSTTQCTFNLFMANQTHTNESLGITMSLCAVAFFSSGGRWRR